MFHPHKLMPPPAVVFTRSEEKGRKGIHLAQFHEAKLKRRLARALEVENYEAAALYRDELKRRGMQ
jgi:protein-arginine kinase activator protein McsA